MPNEISWWNNAGVMTMWNKKKIQILMQIYSSHDKLNLIYRYCNLLLLSSDVIIIALLQNSTDIKCIHSLSNTNSSEPLRQWISLSNLAWTFPGKTWQPHNHFPSHKANGTKINANCTHKGHHRKWKLLSPAMMYDYIIHQQ